MERLTERVGEYIRIKGCKTPDPLSRAERDRLGDIQRGITTCTGCYWYRPAAAVPGMYLMCHYCYDTGELRGIRPADCYKHDGTPYRAGRYRGHGRDIKIKTRRANDKSR